MMAWFIFSDSSWVTGAGTGNNLPNLFVEKYVFYSFSKKLLEMGQSTWITCLVIEINSWDKSAMC